MRWAFYMVPVLFFNAMKKIIILCFPFLISCGRPDDNQTKLNHEYLNKEIGERTLVLSKDTTFSEELNTIREDVENLEHLTIDIENINASIVKSNQYFKEAAKRYYIDSAGFVLLYKGDPLQDIVTTIKKNHLNLLNKIILERNKNGSLMYTAQ